MRIWNGLTAKRVYHSACYACRSSLTAPNKHISKGLAPQLQQQYHADLFQQLNKGPGAAAGVSASSLEQQQS